jgi:hypothetical protein
MHEAHRKFHAVLQLMGQAVNKRGIPGLWEDDSTIFFRDYICAAGFRRSLASRTSPLDVLTQNHAVDESRPPTVAGPWSLPVVNITAVENQAFLDALLKFPLVFVVVTDVSTFLRVIDVYVV